MNLLSDKQPWLRKLNEDTFRLLKEGYVKPKYSHVPEIPLNIDPQILLWVEFINKEREELLKSF